MPVSLVVTNCTWTPACSEFSAHRFSLREGFNIGSHHFSIIDLSNDERKPGLRVGAEHPATADDEAATSDLAARQH